MRLQAEQPLAAVMRGHLLMQLQLQATTHGWVGNCPELQAAVLPLQDIMQRPSNSKSLAGLSCELVSACSARHFTGRRHSAAQFQRRNVEP